MVEHHLYRQQQGADECSSESCLSDRPSPDAMPAGEELPDDDEEAWSTGDQAASTAFEKLRCQMEGEEMEEEEGDEEEEEEEEEERVYCMVYWEKMCIMCSPHVDEDCPSLLYWWCISPSVCCQWLLVSTLFLWKDSLLILAPHRDGWIEGTRVGWSRG